MVANLKISRYFFSITLESNIIKNYNNNILLVKLYFSNVKQVAVCTELKSKYLKVNIYYYYYKYI